MNKNLILTIFTLFFLQLTFGLNKNPKLTAEAGRIEALPKIAEMFDKGDYFSVFKAKG